MKKNDLTEIIEKKTVFCHQVNNIRLVEEQLDQAKASNVERIENFDVLSIDVV